MTFAALYAILTGVLMLGQWLFFLGTRQVPELRTEPARIVFHLAAEFITAIVLILGGWGLLTDATWGFDVFFIAMGMFLYTVINSPGHFVQVREWSMVSVFLILLVSALLVLRLAFRLA